jgi:aldehyde:ferredoxin oxidoreductase
MASISPLTGFFCDSNYGGQFAVAQKRTGYDAIFVDGSSSKPVHLNVTDLGSEIRSAVSFWEKAQRRQSRVCRLKQGRARSAGP